MLKAPRLEPGDTIGIVSPSWGGAGLFPHRVEQGNRYLNALGFRVELTLHALNNRGVCRTRQQIAPKIYMLGLQTPPLRPFWPRSEAIAPAIFSRSWILTSSPVTPRCSGVFRH
jgi:hypothetical protein